MAEAEAEVKAESVVSETTEALPTVKETEPEALPSVKETEPEALPTVKETEPEALPTVKETEPEAPEAPEEGAPAAADEEAVTQGAPDHKRKLEDLDPLGDDEAPAKKQEIHGSEPTPEDSSPAEDEAAPPQEVAAQEIGSEQTDGSGHPTTEEPVTSVDVAASDAAVDGKVGEQQLGQDGEMDGAGLEQVKLETQSLGNGQIESTENMQDAFVDDTQKSTSLAPEQSSLSHARQQTSNDLSTSCKIDVPNNKVGVLIGKSGDTIRYLQINSGAKIQITRDVDSDQNSSTRPVELIGTLENITKAEQLIKDVIAEADAGGSPSLVARGFNAPQSGGEQTEIQIPNEKVGMIIGKGGETIKNLQTKTGARIQLIPQHLPEGDSSKERTVRITGSKKQVEYAKEMIKDVMNQIPIRPSPLSSTYGQQTFRPPRGPSPITQWGSRAPTSTQHTVGYGHQQRGMYPTHTTQYPQTYGGYSQHPPPRGTYGSNWEQQRPAVAPLQTGPQSGGYDYYNQGGPALTTQPSNSLPGPAPGSTTAPVNYNYGQSQAPDGYGHPAPYAQPPPAQQNYGHGYNEPKYDSQPPSQQMYAQQQPMGSHPGMYGQQSATPYGKPAYGAASHETPPSYGPPRGGQSGDPIYQGPPSNQYPSSAPMQHTYPHNSSSQIHQAPYGQSYGPADGYSQQPSAGYPQHGVQPATGYGQAAQAYAQPVPQSGSYSQYPSSQPSYGDPTSQNNVNYGYQGGAPDAGYAGNVANSGYAGQPVGSQPTYSQPPTNPSGYYDQSMPPQSGYGGAPNASVGYAKSISPQPAYGGQYDSSQMYGHQ